MQHSQKPVAILTIGNNGMLFFDGSLYDVGSIERGFVRFIDSSGRSDVVLLIKAESSLDLQAFLELCEFAKNAGFVQVQLAGKKDGQMENIMRIDPVQSGSDFTIPVF